MITLMSYYNDDLSTCMNTVKAASYSFHKALSEQAIAMSMSPKMVLPTNRPWDKLRSLTKNGYAGMHSYVGSK